MARRRSTRARYGSGSVYQRQDGRWVGSIRFARADGGSSRKTVYADTREQAELKLQEIRKLIHDGQPVNLSKDSTGAAVHAWVSNVLPLSSRKPSTIEDYTRQANSRVIPGIGDIPLDKLTPERINRWILQLQTEGLAASTQIRLLSILAMALDHAVHGGKLRTNPARAKATARPRLVKPEVDFYTSDEIRRLRDAAAGRRLAPLLDVAVFTGIRRGEALALRWKDVDLERGQISINGTLRRIQGQLTRQTPKTASSVRTVPIGQQAIDALHAARALQAADRAASRHWSNLAGYVFTTESGEPVDPRNVLRFLAQVKAKAGEQLMMEDLECRHSAALARSHRACAECGKAAKDYLAHGNWHSLRHSYVSWLLRNGTPVHAVSRALGHAKIEITIDTYGHLADTDLSALILGGLRGFGSEDQDNVVPFRTGAV